MSRGSASVLAIGIVAVSASLAAATGFVGHAVSERVAVDGAADAAALAAADTAVGYGSGTPCGAATRAAALNGAILTGCSLRGAVAEVVVGADVAGFAISSRARAGPPSG